MKDTTQKKISDYATRWQLVRDFTEGARKVRDAGETYLPLAAKDQDPKAYTAYKDEVTFHPATGRVLSGLAGIILAKPYSMEAPQSVLALMDSLSYDGESFADIVEWSIRETLGPSYGGILIDFPTGEQPVNAQDELEQGFRPMVSIYAAEKIMWVERARIRNRNMLTYVQLQEEDETRRVLKLVDNVYQVEVWRNDGSGYKLAEAYTPTRLGETIDQIPFEVLTPMAGSIHPTKPLLEDVAELNLDHYRVQGRLTYIHYWQSMAVLYVTGVEAPKQAPAPAEAPTVEGSTELSNRGFAYEDGDDRDDGFKVGGPEAWVLTDAQSKVAYAEFSGAGVQSLERKAAAIEDRIAKVGAQILASEKADAESETVVAMRQEAQYSSLATTTRTLSRKLQNVVRWVAWWMGEDEKKITFSLNTDFRVSSLTDTMLTNIRGMKQTGDMSDETFFYLCQRGGIYPESLTYEEERTRRDEDALRNPEDDGFNTDKADVGSLDE